MDICRVYLFLKLWYRHAYARAPNPSRTDMAKVTKDSATLYQRGDPYLPGRPLVTNINPFQIFNDVSSEAKVEEVVQHLHPHKADRLFSEHFNTLLHKAYLGYGATPPPAPNLEGGCSYWK